MRRRQCRSSALDTGRFDDAIVGEKSNVWSQEPTLVQMRSEMSSMRALLETQLSGLVWKENSRTCRFAPRCSEI